MAGGPLAGGVGRTQAAGTFRGKLQRRGVQALVSPTPQPRRGVVCLWSPEWRGPHLSCLLRAEPPSVCGARRPPRRRLARAEQGPGS